MALTSVHLATEDETISISEDLLFPHDFKVYYPRNSDWSWLELLSYTLSIAGLTITVGFSLSNLFIKAAIEQFWILILTYQLIALSPMMRINFPTLLEKVIEELQFVNGKIEVLLKLYSLSIGRLFYFDY